MRSTKKSFKIGVIGNKEMEVTTLRQRDNKGTAFTVKCFQKFLSSSTKSNILTAF